MAESLSDIVIALAVVPATQAIEHGVHHSIGEDQFDSQIMDDWRSLDTSQTQSCHNLVTEQLLFFNINYYFSGIYKALAITNLIG